MTTVEEIAKHLQCDEDVDKAELAKLAEIIKNEEQDYDDDEKEAIRKGKEFYEKCKESENFEELESPDDRVEMKLVHVMEKVWSLV